VHREADKKNWLERENKDMKNVTRDLKSRIGERERERERERIMIECVKQGKAIFL